MKPHCCQSTYPMTCRPKPQKVYARHASCRSGLMTTQHASRPPLAHLLGLTRLKLWGLVFLQHHLRRANARAGARSCRGDACGRQTMTRACRLICYHGHCTRPGCWSQSQQFARARMNFPCRSLSSSSQILSTSFMRAGRSRYDLLARLALILTGRQADVRIEWQPVQA